jgi:general secretion pathway protein M
MNAITLWYRNLNDREQRLVLLGAIAAAVLLVLAVLLPLDSNLSRANSRVTRKQADLAWMQTAAPALAAAGPAIKAPATQGSLIVVVTSSARESDLGSTLTSTEPSGQGALRVRLDRAPFDNLVTWLSRLSQQNGIRVESATIDAAGAPGLVNASVVLRTN